MTRAIHVVLKLLLAFLVFAMVIIGIKGFTLWKLRNDIDAQVEQVAAFYRQSIDTHTAALSDTEMTPAQTDIVTSFTHIPLTAPVTGKPKVEAIVAAQKAYVRFVESGADTPLASAPAFAALQKDLSRGGAVQAVLTAHNTKAQLWNNQQDDPLGRHFWKVLTMEPRLLLQADGTMEYETTATF